MGYIKRNWGVVPKCSHCDSANPAAICGDCFDHLFCDGACQVAHWKQSHRTECIGGGVAETKKRTRDDDLEEEESLSEITVDQLPRDVWILIARFLSLDDLKSLNRASKDLSERVRRTFFGRYRFRFKSIEQLREPLFTSVAPFISAITVDDAEIVVELKRMGFVIQDVKFEGAVHWDGSRIAKISNLPRTVTRLSIHADHCWGDFPPRLTHLELHLKNYLDQQKLPDSLTHLTLGSDFDFPLGKLPAGLTHLHMGDKFDKPLGEIPSSLVHIKTGLRFGAGWSGPLQNVPEGLVRWDLPVQFRDWPDQKWELGRAYKAQYLQFKASQK